MDEAEKPNYMGVEDYHAKVEPIGAHSQITETLQPGAKCSMCAKSLQSDNVAYDHFAHYHRWICIKCSFAQKDMMFNRNNKQVDPHQWQFQPSHPSMNPGHHYNAKFHRGNLIEEPHSEQHRYQTAQKYAFFPPQDRYGMYYGAGYQNLPVAYPNQPVYHTAHRASFSPHQSIPSYTNLPQSHGYMVGHPPHRPMQGPVYPHDWHVYPHNTKEMTDIHIETLQYRPRENPNVYNNTAVSSSDPINVHYSKPIQQYGEYYSAQIAPDNAQVIDHHKVSHVHQLLAVPHQHVAQIPPNSKFVYEEENRIMKSYPQHLQQKPEQTQSMDAYRQGNAFVNIQTMPMTSQYKPAKHIEISSCRLCKASISQIEAYRNSNPEYCTSCIRNLHEQSTNRQNSGYPVYNPNGQEIMHARAKQEVDLYYKDPRFQAQHYYQSPEVQPTYFHHPDEARFQPLMEQKMNSSHIYARFPVPGEVTQNSHATRPQQTQYSQFPHSADFRTIASEYPAQPSLKPPMRNSAPKSSSFSVAQQHAIVNKHHEEGHADQFDNDLPLPPKRHRGRPKNTSVKERMRVEDDYGDEPPQTPKRGGVSLVPNAITSVAEISDHPSSVYTQLSRSRSSGEASHAGRLLRLTFNLFRPPTLDHILADQVTLPDPEEIRAGLLLRSFVLTNTAVTAGQKRAVNELESICSLVKRARTGDVCTKLSKHLGSLPSPARVTATVTLLYGSIVSNKGRRGDPSPVPSILPGILTAVSNDTKERLFELAAINGLDDENIIEGVKLSGQSAAEIFGIGMNQIVNDRIPRGRGRGRGRLRGGLVRGYNGMTAITRAPLLDDDRVTASEKDADDDASSDHSVDFVLQPQADDPLTKQFTGIPDGDGHILLNEAADGPHPAPVVLKAPRPIMRAVILAAKSALRHKKSDLPVTSVPYPVDGLVLSV